ncbi:CLUMA_CG008527, isoform A [Clunio marinus]|uniref:CLUMA_CG008527, isoform A n=1 Tax=Clunio marinus TaxID=568069 RepID=A0A1J1I632_9DIPT|nr:CLUMA_CG008527, isoform A [Clunio marinus]
MEILLTRKKKTLKLNQNIKRTINFYELKLNHKRNERFRHGSVQLFMILIALKFSLKTFSMLELNQFSFCAFSDTFVVASFR